MKILLCGIEWDRHSEKRIFTWSIAEFVVRDRWYIKWLYSAMFYKQKKTDYMNDRIIK